MKIFQLVILFFLTTVMCFSAFASHTQQGVTSSGVIYQTGGYTLPELKPPPMPAMAKIGGSSAAVIHQTPQFSMAAFLQAIGAPRLGHSRETVDISAVVARHRAGARSERDLQESNRKLLEECRKSISDLLKSPPGRAALNDEVRERIRDQLSPFDSAKATQLQLGLESLSNTPNLPAGSVEQVFCSFDQMSGLIGGLDAIPCQNASACSVKEVAKESLRVGVGELLSAADALKSNGDFSGRMETVSMAKEMAVELLKVTAEVGTSLVPIVSTGRDIYEAVTGKSLITGDDLTVSERALAVVCVASLGAGNWVKGSLKVVEQVARGVKNSHNVEVAAKGVEAAVHFAGKALDAAGEVAKQLTPGRVRNYLSDVQKVPRETLIKDMESIGLKVKGQSPDGKFIEFIDQHGRLRAKIHPPDGATKSDHLHIFDKEGNSLNKALKAVSYKRPDAHIPLQEVVK